MQSVESVMVNSTAQREWHCKKKKNTKKHAPRQIHSFLVDLTSPCIQWRATVCMRAYSVAVSVNVHLRVKITVFMLLLKARSLFGLFR